MILLKRIVPVLVLLALAASPSSAQDNPLFRHIPPEAGTVYHINLPVITAKMSWQEIMSGIPLPKGLSGHGIADLLKDPAGAGIDIGQDLFFAETHDASTGSTVDLTWIVHLSDSARYSAFLRKQSPGLHIITHPGKIRSAAKAGMGEAWNKDLLVIVFATPADHSAAKPDSLTVRAAKKSLAALAGFSQSFYTSDPVFLTGFSDDADLQIWAEQGSGLTQLLKNMKAFNLPDLGSRTSMGKVKNKTLSTLRFGMGRITLQSHVILAPGNETYYTKFSSRSLNTDLLAKIPKGNLLGFISFSFDPSVFDEMMNKAGLRNKLDSQLTKKHLSLDTILHAFKGDFLLAAMEPEQEDPAQKPKVPVYFVAPIGDLPSYHSVAAAFRQMQDSVKPDSSGHKPNLLGNIKTVSGVKDNILVISSTQQNVDAWLNNTEKRNTDFVTTGMKENPVSLLIDFKTMADFVHHMSSQPSGKEKKIQDILDSLDTMIFTGGVMKNGMLETFFELKMTNQKENSLKTLISLMH